MLEVTQRQEVQSKTAKTVSPSQKMDATQERVMGSTGYGSHSGAARPPAVTVVQERETPLTPGVHDPLLFHNGIQAALASVLKHTVPCCSIMAFRQL